MVSLFLPSCEGDKYYPEYPEVAPQTWSQKFEVAYKDWKRVDAPDGVYYYYTFHVPKLSDRVFNEGIKQAFMHYSVNNVDTESPLPFSYFYVLTDGTRWEEHFTVEWQPEYVTFILKVDDGDPKEVSPMHDSYVFSVKFLW
ncbi:hypothetical protein AGMMS49525_12740 [Bacteroidia bacterium]|nr:hypothetical protein AGMMS49525_12740 [Bacteroidia bacterium]